MSLLSTAMALLQLHDQINHDYFGDVEVINALDVMVLQGFMEGFMEPVRINLTDTEFGKLPTKVMSKKLKKNIGKDDEKVECPICLEEIRSRQHCKVLKCNHVFHKNCISNWLMNGCEKPTCPCCRADVRDMI